MNDSKSEKYDITKRMIAESLKDLMSRKPLDKITVREIAENCGIHRQTFYYHFPDIESLIEWMYYDAIKILDIDNLDELSWKEVLFYIFGYFDKNKEMFRSILGSVERYRLKGFFGDDIEFLIRNVILKYVSTLEEADEEAVDFLTIFYTGAVAEIFERYILDEIDLKPDVIIDFIALTAESQLKDAKNRCLLKKDAE